MITSDDLQKASRIPEVIEDQVDPGVYDWINKEIKKYKPYDLCELSETDLFLYRHFFALGVKYGRWNEEEWWDNV